MPKSKNQKRKEALERMERGKGKPANRVKKFPRSDEKREEDIEHLRKLVRVS